MATAMTSSSYLWISQAWHWSAL